MPFVYSFPASWFAIQQLASANHLKSHAKVQCFSKEVPNAKHRCNKLLNRSYTASFLG
jgi:hypothetical protein